MNNLKKRREKLGLTQSQVAEKSKILERSYQRYEANERLPNVHVANRIAKVLKQNVKNYFQNSISRRLFQEGYADTQGCFTKFILVMILIPHLLLSCITFFFKFIEKERKILL